MHFIYTSFARYFYSGRYYDFVIYSDSIQFYEDYLKEYHSDNIILDNEYDSNISKDKKQYILNHYCPLKKIKKGG